MVIFRSDGPLRWGELDLPVLGIGHDWHGVAVRPPAMFSLALDPERLWLLAGHARPAELHPASRPGVFQPELWRHDVAELFIADPPSGRYLELNLAPNSAWWSCVFRGPRDPEPGGEVPLAGVETWADLAPDGSWLAAAAVPLATLRERVGFGPASTANVCLILGSPEQRFLSLAKLGGDEPDFHQPGRFPRLDSRPMSGLPQWPDLPAGDGDR